jgi:FMN-dependent NADH-azoreductase
MAKLLALDSSPMGEQSISRKLTAKFIETWQAMHPEGTVVRRDLSAMKLAPIDGVWVGAAYTPEEQRSEEQKQVLAMSDALISDLEEADEYIFGVAMHNFSIPSTLKLWIDQIARVGKTFSYSANGPVGLLGNKRATVLIATGGVYEPGSAMASANFVEPYLRTVFSFLGIQDLKIITAGGTAQLRSGSVNAETFLAPTLAQVQAHASL